MSEMSYRSAKAHLDNMVSKMDNDQRAFAKLGEVILMAAKAEAEAARLVRKARNLAKEVEEMEQAHKDMVGKLERVKAECKSKSDRAEADNKEKLKQLSDALKAEEAFHKERVANIRAKAEADIRKAKDERAAALSSLDEAKSQEQSALRSLDSLKGRLAKVANA